MRHFLTAILLGLSATANAQTPYLTDAEEAALCEFWNLQYEHLRDTGAYAGIQDFVTGSAPDFHPAWTTELGRFQVDEQYMDLDDFSPWRYEYYGLTLKTKATDSAQRNVLLRPTGDLFVFVGRYASGEPVYEASPCAQSTSDASEDRTRVLDDLVALRDAVWLYRISLGQFPEALPISPSYGRYLNWSAGQLRWGHQYAYASDGETFTVAAWPMRGETLQTHGFYLDQTGALRESSGGSAGPDDPAVTDALPTIPVALGAYPRNEKGALAILCEVHHAQEAYKVETGHYTTAFADLQREPSPPYFDRDMGRTQSGYNFVMGGTGQNFYANANTSEYGVTGNRGFILDSSGLVRAALGRDADPDSPVIGNVCDIDESFQPTGESLPGPARLDTNGDYSLNFSELLLLVQLYNVGEYHCAAETADGYATGPGLRDCPLLEIDNNPQDGTIDLAELLRGIQIYTSGVYFPCPTGEDGLCLPTEPVRLGS